MPHQSTIRQIAMKQASPLCLFLLFSSSLLVLGDARPPGNPNYRDALAKSLLFFQGQRSGPLPATQQIRWRSNSGLSDGLLANVNLTGGYYDAGDNVKFNFPMAFTTTMLSWGTIEFDVLMGPVQRAEARDAIRWATDYLLKCATATPGKLYVGVGDPNADHQCWERPEDMDTVRSVYSVSSSNPGSDVAGETAAALAAASIVFKGADPKYSSLLLETARKVLQFAIDNKGAYSDSLGSAVCPFYCSYSGYEDELLWGAAWLLMATGDDSYYNLVNSYAAATTPGVFSWDNKGAGALVLLSGRFLAGQDNRFEQIKEEAEEFICKILPNSPSTTTKYTKGGLMFNENAPDVNLQYVATATFLLTTYATYMDAASYTFSCGNLLVRPNDLAGLAKRQVDYILGVNPMKMSYMAGFGPNYPQKIHHRGSSVPSLAKHSQHIGCNEGFNTFYSSPEPNPNILTGAIVGGPNENDEFYDDRTDHSHAEPATYINGAIVGPLAYFAGRF